MKVPWSPLNQSSLSGVFPFVESYRSICNVHMQKKTLGIWWNHWGSLGTQSKGMVLGHTDNDFVAQICPTFYQWTALKYNSL